MPKISSFNYVGPLAYSDRLVGVFSGATNGVSLQQFRDFFGVGTNWTANATYPADIADPKWGKDGDFLLVKGTNNVYQRQAGVWAAEASPTFTMAGTRVDDTAISATTSWSSQKIDQYIRGATSVALDLAPNAPRRVPFFSKVLLESLRVSFGTDSISARLLLADGTVVVTIPAAGGAAVIGQLSVSIGTLSAVQVAAGYNVELTYTGAGSLTALLRTIPV